MLRYEGCQIVRSDLLDRLTVSDKLEKLVALKGIESFRADIGDYWRSHFRTF
jgi:hypothetical protein